MPAVALAISLTCHDTWPRSSAPDPPSSAPVPTSSQFYDDSRRPRQRVVTATVNHHNITIQCGGVQWPPRRCVQPPDMMAEPASYPASYRNSCRPLSRRCVQACVECVEAPGPAVGTCRWCRCHSTRVRRRHQTAAAITYMLHNVTQLDNNNGVAFLTYYFDTKSRRGFTLRCTRFRVRTNFATH